MKSVFCLAFASLAAATILPRQSPGTPALTGDPSKLLNACEKVREDITDQLSMGTPDVFIVPSKVLNCLMSVPLDAENDVALIDYLMPYVQFQSNLGYLKNPPAGYLIPGVDVLGGLTEMREKASSGQYANQYHFMSDLARLFAAVGDGHFKYDPNLLRLFRWNRTLELVSFSDGIQLPKVYDVNDFNKSRVEGYTASEVVKIDGISVTDFLVKAASNALNHDPDAQYNGLFSSIAKHSSVFNKFVGGSIPDEHVVAFANGSSKTYKNWGSYLGGTAFVFPSTGPALHEKFELPVNTSTTETAAVTERATESTSTANYRNIDHDYPQNAIVVHRYGYMYGYFLDGDENKDTCVFAIKAFATSNRYPAEQSAPGKGSDYAFNELVEARNLTRTFIKACKDAGRSRLVIDLQGNNGGLLYSGYEIYRNLFPNTNAWSGFRLRETPLLKYVSEKMGHMVDEVGMTFLSSMTTVDGKEFDDKTLLFAPNSIKEDTMSSLAVIDFSNPAGMQANNQGQHFFITGHDVDDAGAPTEPPFKPEDVVVATDGVCGSTCTVFLGLLTREAGVRTVALGGRPMEAPMQAMGSTKGPMTLKMSTFQIVAGALLDAMSNMTMAVELGFPEGIPALPAGLPSPDQAPLLPELDGDLNYRNAYAEGAPETSPPLQFVYESAHCRRFMRPEYLADITQLWKDVAAIAWRGAKCVKGSTANADSTIGAGGKGNAGTVAYSDDFRSTVKYTGPGMVNGGEAPKGVPPASGTANNVGESEKGAAAAGGRVSGVVVAAAVVFAVVMGM